MKILKFGGTSVKDAVAMRRVGEILEGEPGQKIVVLSATAGTTDALLEMVDLAPKGEMKKVSEIKNKLEKQHQGIIKDLGLEKNQTLKKQIKDYFVRVEIFLLGIYYLREITPRAKDAIVAHGELISTRIFANYLQSIQKDCIWFDIRKVMKTNNQFGSAIPNRERLVELTDGLLHPLLNEHEIIVTQGFIGSTTEGLTTTMGRGGSDYTAALLGYALNAETIEIWTDVSGVMTADPRIVKEAFTQRDLSFQEAAELAYFGAKVLHPSTIQPAMDKKIPVIVKNTLKPEDEGTTITYESKRPGVCKAIAFRGKIMILTVESTRMLMAYGFLERIFDVFARHKISVDLISTSEISVSLTIDNSQFKDEIVQELSEFSIVKVTKNMAIVSLIGHNIKSSPHFLNKVFSALDGISIEMITFGTSNVNLSLVVPESQLKESVERLHAAFFINDQKGA